MYPRPTSVLVIGIINLALSVLCGFLCYPVFGVLMFVQIPGEPTMFEEQFYGNHAYFFFMVVMISLTIVGCLVSLVASIGLLGMKEWGRKLTLAYAVYWMVAGLIQGAVQGVFELSHMTSQAGSPGEGTAMLVGGAIGLLFGSLCSLIYPVLQMYFLTRPAVIEAFRNAALGIMPPPPPSWNAGPYAPGPYGHYPPPPYGPPPSGPPPDYYPPQGPPPQGPPPQ